MSQESFREPPQYPSQVEQVVSRANRLFEKGNDHFIARGMLASIAIFMSGNHRELLQQSNIAIVDHLSAKGADVEVYALRTGTTDGVINEFGELVRSSAASDSTDFVRVISRNGVPTNEPYLNEPGDVVIRAPIAQNNQ